MRGMRRLPLVPAVLALTACADTPPPAYPYTSSTDVAQQVAAIDAALITGSGTAWEGEVSGVRGSVLPLSTYRDRQGRLCRQIDIDIDAGQGAVVRTGAYCRQADGTWLPDLPPGAGCDRSRAVGVATRRHDAETGAERRTRDLRRKVKYEILRLNRKLEDRQVVKRRLRRKFSRDKRRQAGIPY